MNACSFLHNCPSPGEIGTLGLQPGASYHEFQTKLKKYYTVYVILASNIVMYLDNKNDKMHLN